MCSVNKSCPTLCDPMDGSTPGLIVLHYLHRVFSDSCPLSRCCYPTISFSAAPFSSCPQSFPASESFLMSWFFTSGGHVLKLKYQSFQWILRVDILWELWPWSSCSARDFQEFSPAPQFKSMNSSVPSFLYSPTLTSKLSHHFLIVQLSYPYGVHSFD